MNDCFYVCSRSESPDGGIYRFRSGGNAPPKAAGFSRFSGINFIAFSPDRRFLYACGHRGEPGVVGTFGVVADGGLKFISELASGGDSTCYLASSPDNRFLYCANYASGSFSEIRLENGVAAGLVKVVRHHGSGPNRERQESAHVHYTDISPDGKYLLVVDLGIDAVLAYRLTVDGVEEKPSKVLNCPPGSGPRHLVFDRSGQLAYLLNELGNSVTSLRYCDGGFTPLFEASTLPRWQRGATKASSVRLSPDGKYLLAGNRGFDSIAVFSLDGQGGMKRYGLFFSGGRSPRDVNFIGSGSLAAAANEESGELVFFDHASGRLTPNGAIERLEGVNYILD